MLLTRGEIKVIFHEPIGTKGLTVEPVHELKNKVYSIIENELKNHGYQQGNA